MKVGLFLVSVLSKNKLVGGKRVFSSDFFKLNHHTIMYTTASLEWKGQTITITRNDDDSIQIYPTIFPSVKAGLREIADVRGISYEPSWNTRYLGMRVLKALNGVKTIDDQIEREAMRSSGIIEEESTSSATLVKITFENVAIIEAMISYDSKYTRAGDPRSVPDKKWLKEFKDKFDKTPEAHEPLGQNSPALLEYNFNEYRGSSAFWMHRLGEYYGYNYGNEFNGFDSVKDYPWYYRFLIYNAVCAVDAENSTHINADKVGRKEITDRIVQYKDDLLKQLKDTKNYPLIGTLSEETNPNEAGNTNPARKNFSFATKFCHYACFYIFENKDVAYRDSYSIYDYIVSNALKTYYGFEDIKPSENDSDAEQFFVEKYRNYQTFIDNLRDNASKAPNTVSRNGASTTCYGITTKAKERTTKNKTQVPQIKD